MSEPTQPAAKLYVDADLLTQLLSKIDSTLSQTEVTLTQTQANVTSLTQQRSALAGQKQIISDLLKVAKPV